PHGGLPAEARARAVSDRLGGMARPSTQSTTRARKAEAASAPGDQRRRAGIRGERSWSARNGFRDRKAARRALAERDARSPKDPLPRPLALGPFADDEGVEREHERGLQEHGGLRRPDGEHGGPSHL